MDPPSSGVRSRAFATRVDRPELGSLRPPDDTGAGGGPMMFGGEGIAPPYLRPGAAAIVPSPLRPNGTAPRDRD